MKRIWFSGRCPGIFAVALLFYLLGGQVGWAAESTNFMLMQEQLISGWGEGQSSTFSGNRGVVGKSGGIGSSSNFILNLGVERIARPPGGNGAAGAPGRVIVYWNQ